MNDFTVEIHAKRGKHSDLKINIKGLDGFGRDFVWVAFVKFVATLTADIEARRRSEVASPIAETLCGANSGMAMVLLDDQAKVSSAVMMNEHLGGEALVSLKYAEMHGFLREAGA